MVHPLFDRNDEGLSVKEHEIHFPNVEKSKPENELCPQSPIPEYAVSLHVQDPTFNG